MDTTPMPRTRLTPPAIFGLAAVVLLAVGLAIGFSPISQHGVSCGSALVESDDALVADYADTFSGFSPRTGVLGGVTAACDDARSNRMVFVYVALVAVAGAGLGVLVTMPRATPASAAAEDEKRRREAS